MATTSITSRLLALIFCFAAASCDGNSSKGDTSPPPPQSFDLTDGSWVIVDSVDLAGNIWDGSTLAFTSQVANGSGYDVEGSFYWQSDTSAGSGTEHFRGTISSSGLVQIEGYMLENASGLVLGDYTATYVQSSNRFVNGQWTNGIDGVWGAAPDAAAGLTLHYIDAGILIVMLFRDDELVRCESVALEVPASAAGPGPAEVSSPKQASSSRSGAL